MINAKKANIALCVLGLVIVLLFILIGKNQMIFDEFYFIPNIYLLDKEGLTKSFLLQINGAAGPTYAVYHHLFFTDGAYSVRNVRLENFILLITLLVFIFLNLKLLGYNNALVICLNFIAIPFVWVFCGLGLTEMPSLTFAMIGFYVFLQGFLSEQPIYYKSILVFVGGLIFSIAILGRSFYLMVSIAAAASTVFFLIKKDKQFTIKERVINYRDSVMLMFVFFVGSVIFPLQLFLVWRGLTPPLGAEAVGADRAAIVPWHGILAFAYAGFIALILAPSWFIVKRNVIYSIVVISCIFIIVNTIFNIYNFSPLNTGVRRILPFNLYLYYGRILPGFLLFLSLYFIYSTLVQLWARRNEGIFVFIGLISIFMVFATVKVTSQFSSRYVGQVLPFFILLFAPFEKTNWNKVARISIGLVLGIISLYSYYTITY